MALSPGTRLGVYEVVALIGAGGMGEVYQARDSKLGRHVALKVLPDSFAADDDRVARFEREAKLLAALNHPHIASLYGLEESAGRRFLVMELIEGDDLSVRICRGPVPQDEALSIARQIADALDAAHEKGIVHRDLKPGNVKITPEGVVKVLDFGLAKESIAGEQEDASERATVLGHTQVGVMVGTAAYMAPEQAQGRVVDKRADIWAFGVVLYEMLTGTCPFLSDSLAGTLAAVLTKDPDLDRVPAALRPLIGQCLIRNPRLRLRDIGDAMPFIDAAQPRAQTPAPASIRWFPWSIAALSVAAAAVTLWVMAASSVRPDPIVSSWVLDFDVENTGSGFGLSRDGRRIAYPARGDADRRLYVRDLDQTDARPIVGTEDGKRPFFSPDGEWFAFFTGQARLGHLMKVPVAGSSFNTRGSATTLCENANLYGGSWGDDDQIVFTGSTGLMRVRASGGPCEAISTSDPKEGDHRWPQVLPGGTRVLFTIGREGYFDNARIAVLDVATRSYRTVLEGGANARYLPSGHLIFVRAGQMFAVPFDLDRLEASGTPQVVVQRIFHVNAGGFAAYDVDRAGTLVYATPLVNGFEWRDRKGAARPVSAPPGIYRYFRLSPDGTRVALQQTGRGDIEIVPLDGGTSERVTSEDMNYTPIWTADGRAITFGTLGKGIFQTSLDGPRTRRPLFETTRDIAPWDWTPDGKTLVYEMGDPLNIWTLTIPEGGGAGEHRMLLGGGKTLYQHPVVSPDGRWLAYSSNESGARQIHVRAFPGVDRLVTISQDGGEAPRWSRDGHELFFLSPRDEVMVSDVRQAPGFSATPPRVLLPSAGPYDVDATGQRFLVVTETTPERFHLVTNFFEEVRRIVANAAR